MSELDDKTVKLGDQEVTLADLAGFDMSDVKAKKFEILPEGFYEFEVTSDPLPDLKIMGEKPAAVIPCKVLNVVTLKDGNIDAASLIGKIHNETNLLNNAESLEYLQATFNAFEANTKQSLRGILHSLAGTKLKAFITHRTDKNDTDKVYAGLKKIEVTEKPTASALASAVGV